MASEAYLNALNSIPKDIQKEVLSSINIASEIHFALKEKGMCSADLARLMGKSESEISKWLTGLHNFTFKTINKIELALDVDIILTKSDRVQEYENKIIELNKKISDLKDELTVKSFEVISVNGQDCNKFIFIPEEDESNIGNFIQFNNQDSIKIKPQSKSQTSCELIK